MKSNFTMKIVVSFLIMVLSILLQGFLENHIRGDFVKYEQANNVTNKKEYWHAKNTNIDSILVQSKINSLEPIKDVNIKGEFIYLEYIEYKEVKKKRRESYKCGESTCYKEVEYYEWEEVDEVRKKVKNISIFGDNIPIGTIDINNFNYLDTIKTGYRMKRDYKGFRNNTNSVTLLYIEENSVIKGEVTKLSNVSDIEQAKENRVFSTKFIFIITFLSFAFLIFTIIKR